MMRKKISPHLQQLQFLKWSSLQVFNEGEKLDWPASLLVAKPKSLELISLLMTEHVH